MPNDPNETIPPKTEPTNEADSISSRKVGAVLGGAILGGSLGGPIGAIVGAVTGAFAADSVIKAESEEK